MTGSVERNHLRNSRKCDPLRFWGFVFFFFPYCPLSVFLHFFSYSLFFLLDSSVAKYRNNACERQTK